MPTAWNIRAKKRQRMGAVPGGPVGAPCSHSATMVQDHAGGDKRRGRMTFMKVGRLALREEGNYWNAYYAQPDTMEDAVLIGSIAMRFVHGNEERQRAFMSLMRESVGDLIEELTGVRPAWPEGVVRAPESERPGHA